MRRQRCTVAKNQINCPPPVPVQVDSRMSGTHMHTRGDYDRTHLSRNHKLNAIFEPSRTGVPACSARGCRTLVPWMVLENISRRPLIAATYRMYGIVVNVTSAWDRNSPRTHPEKLFKPTSVISQEQKKKKNKVFNNKKSDHNKAQL